MALFWQFVAVNLFCSADHRDKTGFNYYDRFHTCVTATEFDIFTYSFGTAMIFMYRCGAGS
jgi:hypothetical protein